MANRMVMSVDVYVDSNAESPERIRGYAVSAFKNACKNIRDGTVLSVIRDTETGKIIGVDLSGTPSSELQEQFEDLIDKLEPPEQRPVPAPPRGANPPR